MKKLCDRCGCAQAVASIEIGIRGASAFADQALVNRAARASRPCGIDPSRKSRSCPSPGHKQKTGPLCRPPPAQRSGLILPLPRYSNGCKGHFRSFGEVSLCVRVAIRRRNFSVVDTTTSFSLKSSLPPSWWLPSRSSLPSSLSWPCRPLSKTGSVNMRTPSIDMHNIETISQMQN